MGEWPKDIVDALECFAQADKALSEVSMRCVVALRACLDDPIDGPLLRKEIQQADQSRQALYDAMGLTTPNDGSGAQQFDRLQTGDVPLPPNEDEAAPKAPEQAGRRPASKAFDFGIFFAVETKRKDRPVSQPDLYALLKAFQARTKRGSLTTKLNRMKESEYLRWTVPEDIQITDLGREKMTDHKRYLSDAEVTGLQDAFETAWNMQVTVR